MPDMQEQEPSAEAAPVATDHAPTEFREDATESNPPDVMGADSVVPNAEEAELASASRGGGLWTIPLICAGIALIAACLIIPAADENHRLVYERERLKADLDQIHKQVDVNDEFLKRVNDDAALLERLAQRQMKMVREGTSVLELKEQSKSRGMSPYGLVNVPPPPPMPAYQPIGGELSTICRNPRNNLYLTGVGLLMIAAGLVASFSSSKTDS
ncbi:MAG TPA: hypothetical protein VL282_00885 [Tepidisphaeraceae bacterium]|nr:hypothetical protein [Tepidisphaeraceae bacterium]